MITILDETRGLVYMAKNYYEIDENEKVEIFLKELNQKKRYNYIILKNSHYPAYVDVRSLALGISKNLDEKLRSIKKPLGVSDTDEPLENLKLLYEIGDKVIKTKSGYFDFVDALRFVIGKDYNFLKEKIYDNDEGEVYYVFDDEKISTAREIFFRKKVRILPVLDKDDRVIGEIRPIDMVESEFLMQSKRQGSFNKKRSSKGRLNAFLGKGAAGEIYDEKDKSNVQNLHVSGIMNRVPKSLSYSDSLMEVASVMAHNSLPSILIVNEDERIYSIMTYKDILAKVVEGLKKPAYSIEYSGTDEIYEEEFRLIKEFALTSMEKITRTSKYNLLKMTFHSHGNNFGTHQKKISVNMNLSYGNHVLTAKKEIIKGTGDEEADNRVKGRWNVPKMVQEALGVLEREVSDENDKRIMWWRKNTRKFLDSGS